MNIVIEIAGKPEAKGRGRVGRVKKANGQEFATVFTPAHTRKYEQLIRMEAGHAMGTRAPLNGPVEVAVFAYLPLPKSMPKKRIADAMAGRIKPCTKPDIDNYVKSALDGIINIVIVDDNQVVALHAHKVYDVRPRLRIEVSDWLSPIKKSKLEDL